MTVAAYELYAIKYAHHDRLRSANFIGGDPHDGPMPMDYFVWLARSAERTFVIDTGFNAEAAARRKRDLVRCPTKGLAMLDVDAAKVPDVIITHLHYDHVGNFDLFPAATFHLQDRELQFATGRHMRADFLRHSFDVENVAGMVKEVYKGRVAFHDGDAEIAPGISVHLVGGHTMGLQFVRVHTRRGWVVVASDASHYYENMLERRPYTTVFSVGDMIQGWDRLLRARGFARPCRARVTTPRCCGVTRRRARTWRASRCASTSHRPPDRATVGTAGGRMASGKIGFIGLGVMGAPMSKRLLERGYDLVVHDRDREAVRRLTAAGATEAASAREVANAAQTVFVSLPTPAIVREVALGEDGIVRGSAVRTFVDLSTTGSIVEREVAAGARRSARSRRSTRRCPAARPARRRARSR